MSRKLRPDERELWSKVVENTKPLVSKRPSKLTLNPKRNELKIELRPLPTSQIGQRARTETAPHPAPSQTPVTMDKDAYTKMRRGKLAPEGRIDLHGMTLDQAHPALIRFILGSHASQRRLVLVITGKGKQSDDTDPIPARRGILKRQVPMWLRQSPLGPLILDITTAHQRHGGGGAFYVYLRRAR